MTKILYCFICLFAILSCKQQPQPAGPLSLRDSVLNIYLMAVDSIAGYDTTTSDFRIMRAYKRNDTTYLNDYLKKRNEAIVYSKGEDYKSYAVYPDSCVHLKRLDKSNYEEAYRFAYTQSFCPFRVNVTATRKGDSAQLDFLLYKPAGDPQWDTSGCKIIQVFTKMLNAKQWQEIDDAMRYADFWALKRESDVHGLDGSTLEVEGYLNERMKVPHPPRYHIVSRWLGRRPAIFDAFALVMKLSGSKEGCFTAN